MLARLRGRKQNERVLKKGQVWVGKHMRVHYLFSPLTEQMCIGVRTPKQLSAKAVERNRMRRRCREAIRVSLAQPEKIPAVLLVVTPKSSSLRAPFTELQLDAQQLLLILLHYYEHNKAA